MLEDDWTYVDFPSYNDNRSYPSPMWEREMPLLDDPRFKNRPLHYNEDLVDGRWIRVGKEEEDGRVKALVWEVTEKGEYIPLEEAPTEKLQLYVNSIEEENED